MGKRLQGIVVGLIVGMIVAGGVAYAAYTVPTVDPQPTDRYYGCFSSVGKLKASTVQVNNAPTQCPAASDVIRSWYAGAEPTGATTSAGPRNIRIHVANFDNTNGSGFAMRARNSGEPSGYTAEYESDVDLSECRRITSVIADLHQAYSNFANVPGTITATIHEKLADGKETGALWTSVPGSMPPGLPAGINVLRASTPLDAPDTGDPVPLTTGRIRFTNTSQVDSFWITDLWVTCKPYA